MAVILINAVHCHVALQCQPWSTLGQPCKQRGQTPGCHTSKPIQVVHPFNVRGSSKTDLHHYRRLLAWPMDSLMRCSTDCQSPGPTPHYTDLQHYRSRICHSNKVQAQNLHMCAQRSICIDMHCCNTRPQRQHFSGLSTHVLMCTFQHIHVYMG